MKFKTQGLGLLGLFILILQGCGSTGTGSGSSATNSITMQGSLSLTGTTSSGIVGSGVLPLAQTTSTREGDNFYCITFEDDPQAFKALIENGEFSGDYEGSAAHSFGCFLVTPDATLPIVVNLEAAGLEILAAAAGSVMAWTMVYDEKTSVVTAEVKITKGQAVNKDEVAEGDGIDLTSLNNQIYSALETERDFYGLSKTTKTQKPQQGPGPVSGPPPEDAGVPPWVTLNYDATHNQLWIGERPTKATRDTDGNWIFRICKDNSEGNAVCENIDIGTDEDSAKQRFDKFYASWKRALANILPSAVVTKWKQAAKDMVKGRFNWCRTRANKEYKIGYLGMEKQQERAQTLRNSGVPESEINFQVFGQIDLDDITAVTSITLARKAIWAGANKGEAIVAVENSSAGWTDYLNVNAWSLSSETGQVFPEPIVVDISNATILENTSLLSAAIVGSSLAHEDPTTGTPATSSEPAANQPAPIVGMEIYELASAISSEDAITKVKSGDFMGNKECDPDFQAREEFLEVLRHVIPALQSAAIQKQLRASLSSNAVESDFSLQNQCEALKNIQPNEIAHLQRMYAEQRKGRDDGFKEAGYEIKYDSNYAPPAGPVGTDPWNFGDVSAPTTYTPVPGYSPGGGHVDPTQYSPNPAPSPYYAPSPYNSPAAIVGVIALGQFAHEDTLTPSPFPSPSPYDSPATNYSPAPVPSQPTTPTYQPPAVPMPSTPGMEAGGGPVGEPSSWLDPMLEEYACGDDNSCEELSTAEATKYLQNQRQGGDGAFECAAAELGDEVIDELAAIATHTLTALPNRDLRPEYTCTEEEVSSGADVAAAIRGVTSSSTFAATRMVCQQELVGNPWPSDVFAILDVETAGNVVKASSVVKRDHRFKVGEEFEGCYEVQGVDANLKQIGEGGVDANRKLTAKHQWLAAFTIYNKNTCKFIMQKDGAVGGSDEKTKYATEDEREATQKYQAELTPVSEGDENYPPDEWFNQLSQ